VDTVSDSEDVGTVARVPEGSGVAKMGLGGEEYRESDIVRRWRASQMEVGRIGRLSTRA
jgi:hypothetical protein